MYIYPTRFAGHFTLLPLSKLNELPGVISLGYEVRVSFWVRVRVRVINSVSKFLRVI